MQGVGCGNLILQLEDMQALRCRCTDKAIQHFSVDRQRERSNIGNHEQQVPVLHGRGDVNRGLQLIRCRLLKNNLSISAVWIQGVSVVQGVGQAGKKDAEREADNQRGEKKSRARDKTLKHKRASKRIK